MLTILFTSNEIPTRTLLGEEGLISGIGDPITAEEFARMPFEEFLTRYGAVHLKHIHERVRERLALEASPR